MAKINPKLLLELIESGMSRRQICSSRHASPHTVSEVKQIVEKNNITTKDIKNMMYKMYSIHITSYNLNSVYLSVFSRGYAPFLVNVNFSPF